MIRLCDLLAVAVDDMRQGGDPRLPLELALIKVTRPGADLDRESLAFRIEQLEQRGPATVAVAETESRVPAPRKDHQRRHLELDQLKPPGSARDPGCRGALGADCVRAARRSLRDRRRHAHRRVPGRRLLPQRQLAEEPKNATLRRCALRGDGPRSPFEVGENEAGRQERRLSEGEFVEEVKQAFDAREVTRMSMPGGMDINKMMQQVQQMQAEMARVQEELATETVEHPPAAAQ